ncbi:MAG: cytochrome c oxidase subunit 3 family protein [Vicinamibacterales bacterium]
MPDQPATAPPHPMLAPQFHSMAQQVAVSELGMWIFLATEVLFFGALFLAYTVYRAWYPDAFAAGSREMATAIGTANTAILIVSSFTVVLAIRGGRLGRPRTQGWMLAATIALGLVFLGLKAWEYTDHIRHHLFPGAGFEWPGEGAVAGQVQIFFTLYYVMTGLHALHMVIGVSVMAVLFVMARRGRFDATYHTPLEVSGLYWHFVDIIWIFLFPLFYLIGLHGTHGS